MSALFGFMLLNGDFPNRPSKEKLELLLKDLILRSKINGGNQTGIAFNKVGKIAVLKKDCPAENFTDCADYSTFLKDNSLTSTYSVIGHCRLKRSIEKQAPTKGPYIAEDVVGVNSGIVTNSEYIYENHKKVFDDFKGTPSESLFRLLNHYLSTLSLSWTESLQKTIDLVKGTKTFVFSYSLDPSKLIFFKDSNANMCVKTFEQEGIVVFARNSIVIDEVVKNVGLRAGKELDFNRGNALMICPRSNQYIKVKVDEK